MTDFNKVKHYYSHFDEKNRLRNRISGTKFIHSASNPLTEKYGTGQSFPDHEIHDNIE